jgi:cholest-4-en-3-one 26-monooxygenase
MTMDAIDGSVLVDAEHFARHGYPHELWAQLRAENPVALMGAPGYDPFWAITKHADIMEIARQPERFSSAQGIALRRQGQVLPPTDIVVMVDPPRHGPLRRVANARFTPRAVRQRRDDVERIALQVLDDALPSDGAAELEFVENIAAPFPLAVVSWILGVPRDDWKLLHRWTNEVIGKDDPEYRQPGESPGKTMKRARGEVHAYFRRLIDDRRSNLADDLVSELITGEIDGAPLTDEQVVLYCELLVEAGNETTRNAISAGLVAFCERGGEWDRLQVNPDLLPDAVEEILRWASPISNFVRTATEDYELRGQTIRAGDQAVLYFASANRDEDVFDAPFEFRIDRRPNPHLAFGFGEHFCMGAHVARVEIEMIYRHLLARLNEIELSGTMERLSSIVNGSIKRLPVRYRMS